MNRAAVKLLFETGDTPTQGDFANFIDSAKFPDDDVNPSVLSAGDRTNLKAAANWNDNGVYTGPAITTVSKGSIELPTDHPYAFVFDGTSWHRLAKDLNIEVMASQAAYDVITPVAGRIYLVPVS